MTNQKINIPINEKPQCPECLKPVDQEELDMFGGLCEDCDQDWNNEILGD